MSRRGRRGLLGLMALAATVYCAAFFISLYTGDLLFEAVPHAGWLVLRFWWWIVPTGLGLGLVLPALAAGSQPVRAALLGSLLAIPVAATVFVVVFVEDAITPKFDVVFGEMNGEKIVSNNVSSTAVHASMLSLFLAAPGCAAAAFILARCQVRAAV